MHPKQRKNNCTHSTQNIGGVLREHLFSVTGLMYCLLLLSANVCLKTRFQACLTELSL